MVVVVVFDGIVQQVVDCCLYYCQWCDDIYWCGLDIDVQVFVVEQVLMVVDDFWQQLVQCDVFGMCCQVCRIMCQYQQQFDQLFYVLCCVQDLLYLLVGMFGQVWLFQCQFGCIGYYCDWCVQFVVGGIDEDLFMFDELFVVVQVVVQCIGDGVQFGIVVWVDFDVLVLNVWL